jgi:surface antigen
MNWNNVKITLFKEIRGIIRDKKSFEKLLIYPLLIPFIIMLFGFLFDVINETTYTVGINYNLTAEEKIRRIELAPAEMQTRVAKAFLREDIDDEDVQYSYNTDSLEQLNDANEQSNVENVDAPMPEGIGAGEFFIRNYKPSNNKNFITTGAGGWNTCVKGYPMDANANVLANCVGYASGRFNEIINEARGTTGCTYKTLNCNAENFIERAQKAGLKTGSTPRVGAIGCAMKGSTLNGSDGAGHVWIVEKVNSETSTYTSESGYGSKAFWNQTRTNSNGRWGMGSAYKFRAYIYLPDDVQKIVDDIVNPPKPEPKPVEPTPTPQPVEPKPTPAAPALKVGDKVKIIGTGNGSSYGKSNTAYGIGWTRQILKIWDGRPYPYQVGNNTGTTGFYKAEALQKK